MLTPWNERLSLRGAPPGTEIDEPLCECGMVESECECPKGTERTMILADYIVVIKDLLDYLAEQEAVCRDDDGTWFWEASGDEIISERDLQEAQQ